MAPKAESPPTQSVKSSSVTPRTPPNRPPSAPDEPSRPSRLAPRATGAPLAVPAHLGAVGSVIWADIWTAAPFLNAELDRHSVLRYCEASEDAVKARAEVDARGLVIEEAISDPRGGIAGHRVVLNPAEAAFRRADKVVTELGDRLGLTPAARARLGLTINQAELAGAEADRILSRMFTIPVIDVEEEDA